MDMTYNTHEGIINTQALLGCGLKFPRGQTTWDTWRYMEGLQGFLQ